jgi:hypothetical protein
MGRHEFRQWVVDTLLNVVSALLQRERGKAIFGIAVICVAILAVWWGRYRYRGVVVPEQIPEDANIPEKEWHAPSAEEVDRVVKGKG